MGTWPEKIENQTCNVRLMRMVEDFYDLEPAPSGEDYFEGDESSEEERRGTSLEIDHFAEDDTTTTSSSNIELRSMKCQIPPDCSCNCDLSCKKGKTITSRRICITQDSEDRLTPPSPITRATPNNNCGFHYSST